MSSRPHRDLQTCWKSSLWYTYLNNLNCCPFFPEMVFYYMYCSNTLGHTHLHLELLFAPFMLLGQVLSLFYPHLWHNAAQWRTGSQQEGLGFHSPEGPRASLCGLCTCLCGFSQIIDLKLTLGVNVRVIACLSSHCGPTYSSSFVPHQLFMVKTVLWLHNGFKILNTAELPSTNYKISPKYSENLNINSGFDCNITLIASFVAVASLF